MWWFFSGDVWFGYVLMRVLLFFGKFCHVLVCFSALWRAVVCCGVL